MDGSKSSMDSCCTTMLLCLISSMGSLDVSDEYTSLTSSNEISSFSKDMDEEVKEIAGASLKPYQFKPMDSNAIDTDQLTEDESFPDEELLPHDMTVLLLLAS